MEAASGRCGEGLGDIVEQFFVPEAEQVWVRRDGRLLLGIEGERWKAHA